MSPVFALVDGSVSLQEIRSKVSALRAKGTIAHADGPQELIPSSEAVERVGRFRQEIEGWVGQTLAELDALGFKSERFKKGLGELDGLLAAASPGIDDLDRPEFSELRQSLL